MKSSLLKSIFTMAVTVAFVASCATKAATPPVPAPVVEAPAAPAKVAKQRTVVTKVPFLVKESSFYSDGLADEYIVYKLDEGKKNAVEKASYDASRPDPVTRIMSEYKDGRLAAESTYESDGKLRGRRELAYDGAGRLVSERSLDAKGKVQSSSSYGYDAKGRKAEWRALDATGAAKATSTYAYGPDGLVGVEMRDAGGKKTGTIALEYALGMLAKRSYFGADGALQKFEAYAYDGKLLSSVENRRADGSFASKTGYAYGPMGELVKAVEYDSSGAAGAYSTYEYLVREDSSTETYYE